MAQWKKLRPVGLAHEGWEVVGRRARGKGFKDGEWEGVWRDEVAKLGRYMGSARLA